MRALVVAAVLVGSLALCAADAPWFCHDYDCPKFEIIKSTEKDIELREYESTVWATTNVTGKKLMDAQSEGYRRLNQYLNKGNDAEQKIEYTNPVFTILYTTSKGPERSVDANFTIEYFVPHDLQDNPPQPSRDDANIVHVDKLRVYVQSFGGYASEDDIVNRGYDLMDKIKDGGEDVYEEYFGFAQYDSWARFVNRHNEVWVWAKQKPS